MTMADHGYVDYEHPFRPWFVRLYNGIAYTLRGMGWKKPLRMDEILHAAERKSGLHDFGNDSFLEPLSLLIDDLEQTANLHPCGRFLIRRQMTNCARQRLMLIDAFKRHPEWMNTPLRSPLYVIGLPRTGTTLLYNLLAQDPNARPLMIWETLFPGRDPKEVAKQSEKQQKKMAKLVTHLINRMAPNLKQVHALEPDAPEECGWLLNNTFSGRMFLLLAALPHYTDFACNYHPERDRLVYDFYKKTLQWLQRGDTTKHWVLKSPAHQAKLQALLEAVPTANIVLTHRDPAKAVASTCSLLAVLRGINSDTLPLKEYGKEVLEDLALSTNHAMQTVQLHPDRCRDVLFERLVKDPIGTVRWIYEQFDYPYSPEHEQRMRHWLENNPQGKHGSHRYDLDQFGLTDADIQQAFGPYRQYLKNLAGEPAPLSQLAGAPV
jgi:hypothetical protein